MSIIEKLHQSIIENLHRLNNLNIGFGLLMIQSINTYSK